MLRLKGCKSGKSGRLVKVGDSLCKYVIERRKEVLLGDIGYTCPYHPLDLLTIYRLERAEAPNIE